jgi:hypothetical protein
MPLFIFALVFSYPTAAMLSSNVSMNLGLTVWSSAWTYIMMLAAIPITFIAISLILGILSAIFTTESPLDKELRKAMKKAEEKYK